MEHLKSSQLGLKGHVCAIPNQLQDICLKLPHLPDDVSFIKVIKHCKLDSEEMASKSFLIRKEKVLGALKWLKTHNVHYEDIEICEENLDWMKEDEEAELKNDGATSVLTINEDDKDHGCLDIGPSTDQINMDNLTTNVGMLDDQFICQPTKKDKKALNELTRSLEIGNSKSKKCTYELPYAVEDAVNEFRPEGQTFAMAFPWLFPGGLGDRDSYDLKGNNLELWFKRLLHYYDGRFASDNIWCFYALNFLNRRRNQMNGSFYVESFYQNGPKSIPELKKELEKGNTEWINRLSYWSYRVKGSAGYWRAKRREVHSWIDHHVKQGNGLPSFFITLSCAEYFWPDVERLLNERLQLTGKGTKITDKNRIKCTNEMTLVIQEYFQY